LLNCHGLDEATHIPDYILAEMVYDLIGVIGKHVKRTLDWHGCDSVCHPSPSIHRDPKPCTCPPDDNPPQPCVEGYALSCCKKIAGQEPSGFAVADHVNGQVETFVEPPFVLGKPDGYYFMVFTEEQ
jgi:hypothetical protein